MGGTGTGEPRSREVAVDAARGFAIVAMIVAHTAVFSRAWSPWGVKVAQGMLNDVASPLFALVIGVTIAINTRWAWDRAPGSTGGRGRFLLQTAIKALALIALGFALEFRFSGVNIVLDYLGATMLVALPLLFLSSRVLLVVIGALLALGPLINAAVRAQVAVDPSLIVPPTPITIALDWLVLGSSYRVTGLLPMLLLGIVLARFLSARTARRSTILLAVGVVSLGVSLFWRQFADEPALVSGGYPDLLRDLGLTLTAFAGFTALFALRRPRLARAVRVLCSPLIAQGTMALSIYALHVLILIALWLPILGPPVSYPAWFGTSAGLAVMGGLLVVCAAFAMAWLRFLGSGPVERLVGVISLRHPPRYLWAAQGSVAPAPSGASTR